MTAIILKRILLLVLLVATLPPGGVAAERMLPAWRYTVRPGDTLINIAERYLVDGGDWSVVRKDNQVDDPYRLLPGTVLRIPAALLRRSPAAVTIEASAGSVRWRSGGGDWQEAASGQRLVAGSALETLEDGHATLRLADASRLLLAPNSHLVFDVLGVYAGGLMVDTRLRLQRGHGDIDANPARRANQHLQIQTPSAQVVVRGTQFRVSADEDATWEGTLAGLVAVSGAGRAVQVAPGRGAITRRGEAPSAPVDLPAAPEVSTLPARFEHLPLRFPLPRLPRAEAWHGQIAAAQAPDRILFSKTARGEALTFADLPNGDYLLRLRAVDGNGLHGIEALHRFVVFARPFPPGLNHPGDAATIRSARPTFAWGRVLNVRDYQVQVASDPEFSHPLQAASSAGNHWQAPADLPAGLLYWRAASVDPAGQQGPWSVASAFTYKPGPGPVDLGRAAVELNSERLLLNLPPPPDGLAYEAMLSPAADLQPVLAQAQASEGRLELPRPDGGSYYLGIRLLDPVDQTPGPLAVQRLEVPYSRLWLLLLLLPLVAL